MHSKLSQRFKTLKVLLGVPNHGSWHPYFGADLHQLLLACSKYKIEAYKDQTIEIAHVRGSILTRSRLEMLKQAKQMNADYLFMIDTDQTFPRGALHRLIHRDVDVIAANIATKHIPPGPTARNKGASLKDWKQVYTRPDSTGIEKVDRVGTGMMLLSRNAFEKLPYNCFDMFYREDIDDVQGEDWSLCESLSDLGFPIYIDHDLSKLVGHMGDLKFEHSMVGEMMRIPPTTQDDDYVRYSQPQSLDEAERVA